MDSHAGIQSCRAQQFLRQMIPPEIIEQVRKTDLLALIGKHVVLKQRGREYWGCCPFHTEKTPSFHVTPSKGIYHCFGCASGGDAVKWMMDFHSLSFTEAVETLASDMGLHFSENKGSLSPKRFKKLAMTEEKKHDEKVAFVDRGRACDLLWEALIKEERIRDFFKAKKISLLTVSSLTEDREIGLWGGRIVYFYPNGAIKIRESLESSRSSRWLKGSADECWLSDWDFKFSETFMFEGETDLMRTGSISKNSDDISMPSASWTPTPEQCYRIGAFREVTLCFDGDRAGREATKRITSLLKKHANGCKVYDLQMPDGMDCCKLTDEELKKLIDEKVEVK